MRAITLHQSATISREVLEQANRLKDLAEMFKPPWGLIYRDRMKRLFLERVKMLEEIYHDGV